MKNKFRDTLSYNRLRELLLYDPDTGIFTRRIATGRHGCHRMGMVVGHLNTSDGYITIRVDNILYLAHRLAWLYMTGTWPTEQIDHKNLLRADNRWNNLRPATHGQNVQNSSLRKNNSLGFKGIGKFKRKCILQKPFYARITINRKEVFLGTFATPEEAHKAYMRAAKKYFGKFARAA